MFGGKDGVPVNGVFSLGYAAMINWDGKSHVLKKIAFLATVEVAGSAVKQHALQPNDRFRIGKSWFQYKTNEKQVR